MLFFNRQRKIPIDPRRYASFFKALARETRRHENDFSVVLVSDRKIRDLNAKFRGKDRPTDVLSFPSGNDRLLRDRDGAEELPCLGEIVISVETARQQATREGHSLEEEIKLLILHGLLHLMGYDHELDDGKMNRKEYALRAHLL